MRQRENELVARAARIMLERTARTVGAEFFRALARGLAETLGTRLGFVGELDPAARTVQVLALWDGDGYAATFTYSLIGTPCAGVIDGELCHYPRKVAERFPDDKMLIDMGIESYIGLPIIGGQGRAIGLLAALHDAETIAAPELMSVLALFADRAAAELERVRFEAELARSEARYRQIVSSCIEGVWVIDAGAATTFVNRQMATMLGYSEAEMLGRPLSAFMDAAGKAVADANLARRASGVAELHEFRFLHKEGHDVWTQVAANPLFDEAGAYAGALALATDVTDRRQLDAAAQQTQRLESLGVLAGGVAHDFNNLLVGILGNAELALRATPPSRAALEDIRSAALRATDLTHQLLAFAGKGKFLMSPIDLNAVIADMARLLSTAISKKTVLRLVPTRELAMVKADSGQLSQVVMNLITNASEALGDRPGTVTVTTGVRHVDRDELLRSFASDMPHGGDYVSLEVTDDGCGMDDATRARIFDPFFTTKFTGRGLGLAALLGVVRSHRGAIRVDSEVGKGTTFEILLPAAPVERAEQPAALAKERGDARLPAGRVVLVADDEPLIRTVVGRFLAAEGCTVVEAVDGPDALAKFGAHGAGIDIVLLDMTMPGLSGAEVFHELRRRRADVKVLLSSGYAEEDAAAEVGDRANGFLAKPWTANALVAAVRSLLDPPTAPDGAATLAG